MQDVIQSVSSAIVLAKQLLELAGKTKNAEMKSVVADLTLELAQVKMKLAELIEENTMLKQKLSVARGGGPQLEYRDGLYFDSEGGPFCPGCFDSNRKAIRLAKQVDHWASFGEYMCPHCKEHVNTIRE